MEIKEIGLQDIDGGDILIGHGLLISPAYLLERKKEVSLDPGRLLDSSTLINALTLHKRLITLPAFIPSDLKNSRLYKFLVDEKILCHLKFDYDSIGKKREIEMKRLLDREVTKEEVDLVAGAIEKLVYDEYILDDNLGTDVDSNRMQFIDEIIHMDKRDWFQKPPPNSVLTNDSKLHKYLLRTLIYWEIADMADIPFMVDLLRIPIIAGYEVRLRQDIRMFLAANVNRLDNAKMEILQGFAGFKTVPTPNSFSNFLNRYYQTSDLEGSLKNMREEFSEERGIIVKWEHDLRDENKTQEEAIGIMDKMISSLNALKKTDWNAIVVSAGPRIGTSLLDGSIGFSASESLIKGAFDIVKRMWERNRIKIYNDGKIEAAKIKNQPELLRHAFGDDLTTNRQIDVYLRLCNSLNELTKPI